MSDQEDEIEEIIIIGQRPPSQLVDSFGGGFFSSTVQKFILETTDNIEFFGSTSLRDIITHAPGDIVFRIDGVAVLVDAANLSDARLGDIIKTITEGFESSHVKRALDHIRDNNITLRIDYDDHPQGVFGTNIGNFASGELGVTAENLGSNGLAVPNSIVVITLNSSEISNTDARLFQQTLIHEIIHIGNPGGSGSDEVLTASQTIPAFNDIFKTNGTLESNGIDFVISRISNGTSEADNFAGASGNDNLAGNLGNDTLFGYAGNDFLEGGDGNDRLNGGIGNDLIDGGTGNDLLIFNGNHVGNDIVVDSAGTDRLRILNVTFDDLVFEEFNSTLLIRNTTGTFEIAVFEFLNAIPSLQTNIETFEFGSELFAASFIRDLINNPEGLPGDDDPFEFVFPVVLDLDGDGIELTSVDESRVRADADGDGIPDFLGFVSGDDGILALDRNGNGRIDDVSEISFVQDLIGAQSDLEGLLAFDTNADGILDASDERFDEFLIFRDINGNGTSQPFELFTLAELGITSIDLTRNPTGASLDGADDNVILNTSFFTRADGTTGTVGDVALFFELGGGNNASGVENTAAPFANEQFAEEPSDQLIYGDTIL